MTLRIAILLTALTAYSLTQSGCASEPVLRGDQTRIAAADYGRTFDAAVEVLRRERLGVDRQDYRFGVITSHARPSPVLVEVWDSANSTAYQAVESTLNDQRRVVRITLQPIDAQATDNAVPDAAAADQYVLRVEALIERFHNPQYHLSGSTQGHLAIAPLRAVPDEWRRRGIDGPFWTVVRRDPYLEERLLNAIVAEAVTPPPAPPAHDVPPDEAVEP